MDKDWFARSFFFAFVFSSSKSRVVIHFRGIVAIRRGITIATATTEDRAETARQLELVHGSEIRPVSDSVNCLA